jgi:hypothetical protein
MSRKVLLYVYDELPPKYQSHGGALFHDSWLLNRTQENKKHGKRQRRTLSQTETDKHQLQAVHRVKVQLYYHSDDTGKKLKK